MYDGCPERIVGCGIPAQSRVQLVNVVSIRWHRVHTCQFLVLASHTQRVSVGLRDNARRLSPRTALSGQYMFPFASQFQSVWRLQHVRRSLALAGFKQRVDDCFHGNAQQLSRSSLAALEQYVFSLCFHSQPVLLQQACQKLTSTVYSWDHCICSTSSQRCEILVRRRAHRFNIALFASECKQT